MAKPITNLQEALAAMSLSIRRRFQPRNSEAAFMFVINHLLDNSGSGGGDSSGEISALKKEVESLRAAVAKLQPAPAEKKPVEKTVKPKVPRKKRSVE